jgi:hypothetical protein
MSITKANYRVQAEESMFRHLSEHLDPGLKRKVPPSALREILSCLADWAYVERNKWLAERGADAKPEHQELKERLKPDGNGTTFLDAIDEIR